MRLLFVYNANSGKLNGFFDAGHKLISPSTYKCKLCALTHNTFFEKENWKRFRTVYGVPMTFYHKDEFEVKYPNNNLIYPVILKQKEQRLSVVLNADDLKEVLSVDDLIAKLKNLLKEE